MKENMEFNQYVEAYKLLPLKEKKTKVNEELKKTIAFLAKALNDINVDSTILYNREILDLNKEEISDTDFVEAMFVYTNTIQELIGKYFNSIAKILYKEGDKSETN